MCARRRPPWVPPIATHGPTGAGRSGPAVQGLQRILVIEDEPAMRQWVCQELEAGTYRVLEASRGEDAVELVRREEIHGALVDIMMPDADIEGIAAARILWYEWNIPCMMLTSQSQGALRLAATYAGARGYLIKERVTAELVRESMAQMLAGERIPDHVDGLLLSDAERTRIHALGTELERRQQLLTPREQQIEHLITQGKSNRDIAADLGIERKTVDSHVSNILGKLGMGTRRAMQDYQVMFDSAW